MGKKVRVALVGRPNVGKSTLFNRFAGKNLAIVEDTPGVTRDWREAPGSIGDLSFTIVDTAGLEDSKTQDMMIQLMEAQSRKAALDADVVLFMIDGQAGVTAIDESLSRWLHKLGKPVVLVINKCDSYRDPKVSATMQESFTLGFGDFVAISAAHKEGWLDLYSALSPHVEGDYEEPVVDPEDRPIQIAIIGRPNVGKSTLINKIIGEERMITGDMPGVTRDAITVDWSFGGRNLKLIDTAGVRRQARITEKLEKMSAGDTLRAIKFANVVALVVDATQALEKQDLTLARHVVEEGRGLVIVVNKCDLLEDKNAFREEMRYMLNHSLAQVRDIPLILVSALEDRSLSSILKGIFEIYDLWNKRLPTGPLNRWLRAAVDRHPTPIIGRTRIALKYITQVKSRPPTFTIFATKAADLPDSYVRYLTSGMREAFGMKGVPIRFLIRKQHNPFDDDGKK